MNNNNELNKEGRDQFKSNLGFVLATAGSAVGLGNIWRFPYITGKYGGGAFLFVYLVILITIGVSLLLVEFTVGRHGKNNAIDAYGAISKKAKPVGYLGFFTAFIALSYYSVIGGWTIYFAVSSITGTLSGVAPTEMSGFFGTFISNPSTPLFFHLIFSFATIFIILRGISKGIEKYSKILMPALLVMILILVARAITLDGAWEGVKWYLTPDFSKIDASVILAALGQVFFSLSVGMSGMVTYSSYLPKETNLTKAAIQVGLADTTIALLAGFMIFPVLFSFGVEPGEGVGLVFITMPMVFSKIPLGGLFSFLFFALLAFASLTSAISILEMPVTILIEKKKNLSRKKATLLVGGTAFVLGIFVSLGFGPLSSVTFAGLDIFGVFDFFVSNISMPLGALGGAITVGWLWNKNKAIQEITSSGLYKVPYANAWYGIVKYVAPVAIILIIFLSIGII